MPKKTAPRLGTAYGWTLGEGPWNTDMDANLKMIDALLGGGSVISNTQTAPGGGGSSYTGIGPADQDLISSSNYAWKGNLLTASQNSFVMSIDARLYVQSASSVTFQATIAAASGGKITGTPVFSATVTPSTTGWQTVTFNFNTPVPVTSGTQYAVMIGAVGKGATYALPASIPESSLWPSNSWFTMTTICRSAADPIAVNTTYDTGSGGASTVILRLNGNASGTAIAEGDAYIIPANATGAWAGKTNQIAVYVDGAWLYIVPKRGLRIEVQSAGGFMWFNGTAWTAEPSSGGGGTQLLSNRNLFVDGAFDSWSVGTSFNLTSIGYTADMWVADPGTGGATTVSRQAYASGSNLANSPVEPRYFLRFSQTTAATANPALIQRLEGVGSFAGKSATVAFNLKAAAALSISTIRVVQNFGTGGSPSAQVTTDIPVTWNVTTTEQRFSARLDIPSIAGKTIGTNGDDFLQISALLPTGQTFTLDFGQAQIEPCDAGAPAVGTPTPFEYRGPAAEKLRVSRYLQIGYTRLTLNQNLYSGSMTRFGISLRVAPAISYSDGGGNSSKAWTAGGGFNQSPSAGQTVTSPDADTFITDAIWPTGAGNWVSFTWVADARF